MPPGRILLRLAILALVPVGIARAEDDFERAPIAYSTTTPDNPVERLQKRLDAGTAVLRHDEHLGYLADVLGALGVPVSSQVLVFSKTSLQQRRITPRNPRALYFNDEVYLGYVRSGDVLEVAVADPLLGTVFYTLDQAAAERPRFERRTEDCLLCHGGSQTRGVPGHVIRSVHPDASGQPILSLGSHRVDQTTPLADRWGGWYVTGTHGDQTHLGNVTLRGRSGDEPASREGLNLTSLDGRFDPRGYPAAASDLVALTVLVHQTHAHNVITQAGFAARMALHREAALNRDLHEPEGKRWPSTDTVLRSAVDALVDCFLFRDEAALGGPLTGTTTFAADYAAAGPRDGAGRSLRDLDLRSRLLRHPCSPLVYSASFAALPEEVRERFWARLDAVLTAAPGGSDDPFHHLTAEDRTAIRQILAATHPAAPARWRGP